jgi:hypothetical protein
MPPMGDSCRDLPEIIRIAERQLPQINTNSLSWVVLGANEYSLPIPIPHFIFLLFIFLSPVCKPASAEPVTGAPRYSSQPGQVIAENRNYP